MLRELAELSNRLILPDHIEKIEDFFDSDKEEDFLILECPPGLGDTFPFSEDVLSIVLEDIPLVDFIPFGRMKRFLSTGLDTEILLKFLDFEDEVYIEEAIISGLEGIFFFWEDDVKFVYINSLVKDSRGERMKSFFILHKDVIRSIEEKINVYYDRIKEGEGDESGYASIPIIIGRKRGLLRINPKEFEGENFFKKHFDFEEILEDTIKFLTRDDTDEFIEKGIPKKRGLIFEGPPGTGKTKLLRYLIYYGWKEGIGTGWLSPTELIKGELRFTTFFDDIVNSYKKKFIILEDIDQLFSQVEDSLFHSELLQIFDGLDQGMLDNSVIIATVNRLEKIPYQFRRPGRFDRIYHFRRLNPDEIEELTGIRVPRTLTISETKELKLLVDEGLREEEALDKIIRLRYKNGSGRIGFS